jgi:hypothetical protein
MSGRHFADEVLAHRARRRFIWFVVTALAATSAVLAFTHYVDRISAARAATPPSSSSSSSSPSLKQPPPTPTPPKTTTTSKLEPLPLAPLPADRARVPYCARAHVRGNAASAARGGTRDSGIGTYSLRGQWVVDAARRFRGEATPYDLTTCPM